MVKITPPPHTIKGYFTPIPLGERGKPFDIRGAYSLSNLSCKTRLKNPFKVDDCGRCKQMPLTDQITCLCPQVVNVRNCHLIQVPGSAIRIRIRNEGICLHPDK